MRKALPYQFPWTKYALTLLILIGSSWLLSAQTFSGLPSSACVSDGPSTLSGSIAGGTFSGPGVSGSTFDPNAAGPGTHVITFSPPRYRVETITHVASAGAGTTIALGDDANSGAIPLGFTLDFFDNNFTNVYISSNGFISMVANATTSSAVGNQVLPNTAVPNNMIAFAMTDLDPGNGLRGIGANRLWYQRSGVAPNRLFTYNFRRVDQFTTGNLVTGKVVIREGSDIIEVHLTAKPNDASNCTEGIENANGTVAFTVAGRNGSQWAATNSAHRFVPQLPVTQTVIVSNHNSAITCPANVTVSNDPGQCSAIVNYTAPTVSDDCFLLRDEFSTVVNTAIWDSISFGTVNNSCGSPTGNHLYFNGTGSRFAETFDFNTTSGGNITFNINFGNGVSPCENADAGEGSVLEYSNDGGTTFTTIATYDQDVNINWNAISEPIPAAAQTTSTRFRWRQLSNSGNNFDNWGIDNVMIPTGPPATQNGGIASGGSFPLGVTTNTYTYTDAGGSTVNCSFSVTVNDTEAPNAVCQNVTASLNGSGAASITAAQINGGSSDNCGIASTSVNPSSFDCNDLGSASATLTVTDTSGNTANCTANVSVEDNISPTAVCQAVTIQLDANGNAGLSAGQVDGGSNDNCGIVSSSIAPSSFPCANLGANVATLIVTDGSGNSDNCVALVTVEDVLPPSAVCLPVTVQLDGSGNGSISANQIDGGSTDNCGIASLAASQTAFSCADLGNNNVVLTVTDNNGNAANCTAVVAVEDVTPPNASCQDVTVSLDGAGNASVTAAQVNNGSTDNCGITGVTVSPSNFTCSNVGSNQVTLTVTDSSGNAANCTATVTVEDNIAPSAVCQPVTVQLDANGNGSVTTTQVDGGSTDNCTLANTTVVPSTFDCNDIGSNAVTLTVTDVGGNSDNCTTTVSVEDNLAPIALCNDLTLQLNANGVASLTPTDVNAGSTDNCGIDSLVASPTSFNCSNVGSNNVILTVTDVNGNASFCTAFITIEDTLPPVAVCQNDTVQLDSVGNAAISAMDIDGGSIDNCSAVSNFSASPSSFTCSDVGMNNVVLTVTDAGGNADSCTAMVLVEDALAPTAVCQAVTVQLDTLGNASTSASDLDGGSTDNCGIAMIMASPTSFTCADLGMNQVLLTVTDSAGNSDTCSAMVTVEDNIAPTAVCAGNTFQLDSSGVLSLSGADLDGGSSDNCGIASLSASPNTFGCSDLGSNTVTLTVSDAAGNTDTCSTVIVVADGTAPVAVCQNITIQLNPNGVADITPVDVDGGSTDNCAIDTATVSPNSFFCFDAGNNTVVLAVADGSGNVDTCNAVVTVEDGTPPTAVCQDATVQLDANGSGAITAADINNGSSDNCGTPQVSVNMTNFTCVDLGLNTVTLTATDFGGNSDTCNATVTVIDVDPPVAICQNITVTLSPNGVANITPADVDGGSTDNCGVDSLAVTPSSFTCADVGNNTVLLGVSDASGNLDTCSAIVVVEDTLAPTALCQNVTVTLDSTGLGSITAADLDAGSSDICGIDTIFASPTTFSCQGSNNQSVLTVVDVNGNTSTCTANIQISDSIPPMAICQNTIVYLDSMGMAGITASDLDGGSIDACGIDTILISSNSFDCANVNAPVSVTLTVVDGGGNVDSCTSAVTVLDTIAPTITCPGNTVLPAAPGQCSEQPIFVPNTFVDNCAGTALFAQIDSSGLTNGSVFPVGVTVQSYSITDASGNADTCVYTVTIVDTEAPVVACPADTTVSNDSAQCSAIVILPIAAATDNCGVDSVMNSFNGSNDASGIYPVGVTTVLFTASDTSGNLDTCSFVVTVLDTEAPIVLCPADTTVPADSVGCASAVNWAPVVGFDNCGVDTLIASAVNGSAFPAGVTTVSYVVVDSSGNLDSCDFDITVVTAPLTSSITAVTYNCGHNVSCNGDSDGEATVTFGGGCGPYSILWSNGDTTATTSNLMAGTYSVTITDSLGASMTDSIVLTEPTLITIAGVVGGTVCGNDSTGSIDVTTTGGNDCSGGYTFNWSNGATTEDLSGVPAGTYTLTVTDLSGCTASESFTITSTPLPNPNVFKQGDTLFVNGTYQAYQWNRDGNVLSGATFAFYVPNQSGSFHVTVTDSNGCVGNSDTLFCEIVSAEGALGEVFGLELFPNPTSGVVYLRSLKPIDRKVTITVMDIYGHTVKHYRLNGLRDTREIDLTNVANGMYILKLEDDKGGAASVRFMVE